MTAIALVARTLRRRLAASLLAIALVAGVAGGVTTGLAVGAARTRTAPARAISAAHVLDLMLSASTITPAQMEQIRSIPGVRGASQLAALGLVPVGQEYFYTTASIDGRWGRDVDVARIVRGRPANPSSAGEVVLSETVASFIHADVGDALHFQSWSPEQLAAWRGREPTPEERAVFRGPNVDLEVVGISRHPADLGSDDPLDFFTVLPPAFWAAYQGRVGAWGSMVTIDIGDAPSQARVASIGADLLKVAGRDASLDEAGEAQGGPLVETLGFVALAMLALAAAVGVAGAALGGLLVARTVAGAAEDTASLAPLGMTGRERARSITAALAPAVMGAAALAFVVAIACSTVLPFGLARRADPDPGLHVDVAVLAAGALATSMILLGIIALVADRASRRGTSADDATCRPGFVARLARSSGLLPVGALCGVDLATARPRGRGVNRGAALGVALATIAGVGALVLVTSVDHVFRHPAAYGWTWDYAVRDDIASQLTDDPAVEAVGLVTSTPVSLEGQAIETRGVSSLKGELPLLVVRGRAPGPGEIVLGARTMSTLGVRLGDSVDAQGSVRERPLRVVGEAVFAGVLDVPEAGWGAAVPLSELDALGARDDSTTSALVALADGADHQAFERRVAALSGEAPKTAEAPVELERLREIESFPWLLTGFLVGAGFVVVGHALVVTVHRRRGDLAVLRAMGLGRGGVYQAITVEGAVLASSGVLIGVPLGVAAGQAIWRGLAANLGIVVTVEVPWAAIGAAAIAAFLAITAMALVPARNATRVRPAAQLRAE